MIVPDISDHHHGYMLTEKVIGKILLTHLFQEENILKEDDYDIMIRGNRHEIVSDGWIHDQDNKKVIKNQHLKR